MTEHHRGIAPPAGDPSIAERNAQPAVLQPLFHPATDTMIERAKRERADRKSVV